jgi:hypothetical protein
MREFTTQGGVIPMSAAAAELVLALWVVSLLALGGWRTVTRDA